MSKHAAPLTSAHPRAGRTAQSELNGRMRREVESRDGESAAPPLVRDVLRSPGRPLDSGTRARMERHLGYDFSGVRVHTDAAAAESALKLSARAYASGQNIVFGSGQYTTSTQRGRQLLAHELRHVVQQSNGEAKAIEGVAGDPVARRSLERRASEAGAGFGSASADSQSTQRADGHPLRPLPTSGHAFVVQLQPDLDDAHMRLRAMQNPAAGERSAVPELVRGLRGPNGEPVFDARSLPETRRELFNDVLDEILTNYDYLTGSAADGEGPMRRNPSTRAARDAALQRLRASDRASVFIGRTLRMFFRRNSTYGPCIVDVTLSDYNGYLARVMALTTNRDARAGLITEAVAEALNTNGEIPIAPMSSRGNVSGRGTPRVSAPARGTIELIALEPGGTGGAGQLPQGPSRTDAPPPRLRPTIAPSAPPPPLVPQTIGPRPPPRQLSPTIASPPSPAPQVPRPIIPNVPRLRPTDVLRPGATPALPRGPQVPRPIVPEVPGAAVRPISIGGYVGGTLGTFAVSLFLSWLSSRAVERVVENQLRREMERIRPEIQRRVEALRAQAAELRSTFPGSPIYLNVEMFITEFTGLLVRGGTQPAPAYDVSLVSVDLGLQDVTRTHAADPSLVDAFGIPSGQARYISHRYSTLVTE